MISDLDEINFLLVITLITGLFALYYLILLLVKLKELSIFEVSKKSFGLVFFGLVTSFFAFILIGTIGYQRLTEEQLIANVKINSYQPQSFQARIIFTDGQQQVFSLKGDELLIDAYVLKWKSWANLLGFHTSYRLERVSGRYKDIEQEKNNLKSVYSINSEAGKGIAEWRKSYKPLSFLLDVEHGSASFVNAENEMEYQLMITTSGLLIRPLEKNT